MENKKKSIKSFHDLEVYQNTYDAMLTVFQGYTSETSKGRRI
jgi:hypothetical protein